MPIDFSGMKSTKILVWSLFHRKETYISQQSVQLPIEQKTGQLSTKTNEWLRGQQAELIGGNIRWESAYTILLEKKSFISVVPVLYSFPKNYLEITSAKEGGADGIHRRKERRKKKLKNKFVTK